MNDTLATRLKGALSETPWLISAKHSSLFILGLAATGCDDARKLVERERINHTYQERPLATNAGESRLCSTVATASDGGKASMLSALTSGPRGLAYIGKSIRRVRFWGGGILDKTQMHEGRCWANALVKDVTSRGTDIYHWSCPVAIISDDPARIGKTVLEEVDEKSCQFGADKSAVRLDKHARITRVNL